MQWRWIVAAISGVALSAGAALADPMPRTIIALYDGDHRYEQTLVHRFAELPLNHLGLVVEGYNINDGLPDIANRTDVRGVLTWFRDAPHPVSDPIAYMQWVQGAMDHGKKFVVLGNPGFIFDVRQRPELEAPANALLARIGLHYDICTPEEYRRNKALDASHTPHLYCEWVADGTRSNYVLKNTDMVEYERKLTPIPPYNIYHQVDPKLVSYLTARQGDKKETDSVLVSTNEHGGYVDIEFAVHTHWDAKTGKDDRAWYINPFRFFAAAFATDDLPKPDTTTLDGNRIYYSHIDGDSFNSISDAKRYENRHVRSSQVVMEQLIAPYPDLPVTVAVIAADIDPAWIGTPESREIARTIFALPQVEPASHTYSHPYNWAYFKKYDAESEKTADPKPRAYANAPFSLDQEIAGARDALQPLAGDKPIHTLMLSGDTSPYADVLAKARKAGLVAINGGDSRWDHDFPSLSWVAPLGRHAGGEVQIYASNSNDNTYTHGEQPPYDGFKLLHETIEHTEHPIRLKPFNIYYHMFAGDHQASIDAVKQNLAEAKKATLIPIEASSYAKLAQGFYTAQMEAVTPQHWRITHRGALQTIRFDKLTSVDWSCAHGVIGAMQYQGSTYVALDPAADPAEICLTPTAADDHFYLTQSRWRISEVKTQPDGVRFTAQGYGPLQMSWHVPADGDYLLQATDAAGNALPVASATAKDNQVAWTLPLPAMQSYTITLHSVK